MNGNLLAALESYTQAATINSYLADAYCGKGYVDTDLGLQQAIEDYSQAITVDPNQIIPADWSGREKTSHCGQQN